jgi:putative transposase
MELTQLQISEVLTTLAREKDGFKQLMTLTIDAMMKAEREIHNEKVLDSSNGFRPRRVFSSGHLLQIKVPRSRNGNFYPMLLATLNDQQEEAQSIVYELYTAGLTTEQISDIFEKTYGKAYSKSQISNLMDYAREEIKLWSERKLDTYYPIIYIDATYIFTRRERVSKEAYYTILGVRNDMTREVLAVVNSPTESATVWQETFQSIKERGVLEIGLVVSDGLAGIENAIISVFAMADQQLCTVHLARGVLSKVKPTDKAAIGEELKVVFNPDNELDSSETGYQRWIIFVDKWLKKYPSFRHYKDHRYRLYFTYLSYNKAIRRMIYTTNWIERLNRNYKRTTRIRAALPSAESVLFLLNSVARNQKCYDYPITNFRNDTKLFRIIT